MKIQSYKKKKKEKHNILIIFNFYFIIILYLQVIQFIAMISSILNIKKKLLKLLNDSAHFNLQY